MLDNASMCGQAIGTDEREWTVMPPNPPKSPFRGLLRVWHAILASGIVSIDGIKLHSDPASVPKQVRRGLFKGDYEAAERALLPYAVKPGDRVLEIGAGIGLISMLCNRLASPAPVVSFEANPKMAETIRRNFALNAMDCVLIMKAVTEDGAPLRFFVDDNIISSSMIRRNDKMEEVEVPSEAINTAIAAHQPDVIVMDVEGAEIGLLGTADLSSVKRILVEMHPHIVGKAAVEELNANLEAEGLCLVARSSLNYLFARMDR